MFKEWIDRQNNDDQRHEPRQALESFWELVSSASNAQIKGLMSDLMDDPYGSLVSVPLYDSDSTSLLVRIVDRLDPDTSQADMLEDRFPLTWETSVMDGEAFDARVLLNGDVLVRSRHRVLGPNLWEGQSLISDPDLIQTLTHDLAILRSRNADGSPACFLLVHDEHGARLLASDEPVDLGALGWGQFIGICAFEPEDLEEGSDMQTSLLREIASAARSEIVFLRFYGDRIDIIPACRLDDDLDIFLEELASSGLCENVCQGKQLNIPLSGDDLVAAIIEHSENEIHHIASSGPGASWLKNIAIPLLAKRLSSRMRGLTPNFGLGSHPNGPRRPIPLPLGVDDAIGDDLSLLRRSITLQVTATQAQTHETIRDGKLPSCIEEAFENSCGEVVEISLLGRVQHYLMEDDAPSLLQKAEELYEAFGTSLDAILAKAEEDEEDVDDAIENAGLGVIILIDFPNMRPADQAIAGMAKLLSASLEETVSVYLNGRGEYLSYYHGDVDSGDHELFRLDDLSDYDADDDF